VVVGAEAKQRRIIDPRNTVYSAKRLIGRTFRSREVTAATERMAYQIKEGLNQQPVIVTRAGEFAVPEISAIVLDHMRRIAEKQLESTANRAVITVPANFTDAQRSATATAGAIAGLTVVRVLNEPTAAALAYGHNRQLNKIIAVYDFGGGTFDITLLQLKDTVFQVLATAGDSFLGGDDIDERLVDHMVQMFLAQHRIDLRTNITSMQRLRAVAEQIKIELSRKRRAVVKIDEVAYGEGGAPLDLQLEVTREEFVSRVADIVERTFPVCTEALATAGLAGAQIDDVVLVGGTTKMPLVRERVAQFFAKQPRVDVNPDEAVAVGAALQGISLQRILGRAQTDGRAASPGARTLVEATPPRRTAPGPVPAPAAGEDEPTAVRGGEPPSASPPPIPPRGRTKPGMPAAQPPGPTERRPAPGAHVDDFAMPEVVAEGVPLGRIGQATGGPAALATRTPTGFDDIDTDIVQRPPPRPLSEADLADLLFTPATSAAPPASPPAAPPQAPTLVGALAAPTPPATPTATPPQAPTLIGAPAAAAATLIGVPAATPPAASLAPVSEPFHLRGAGVSVPAPPIATVLDVTPHSLGIGTIAGFCEELIPRNSQVPTETQRVFATSRDLQDMVLIRVCQGESRRLEENVVLGDLTLTGLTPRPRGQTQIQVTFHIDASGILHVRARDQATGKEQRANLNVLGAQSAEQVDAARARLQEIRR
jgi:molecular chaperone DnaK